jgi:hypothetical protein
MPIDYFSPTFKLNNNIYIIKARYFTQELLPYKEDIIRIVSY